MVFDVDEIIEMIGNMSSYEIVMNVFDSVPIEGVSY